MTSVKVSVNLKVFFQYKLLLFFAKTNVCPLLTEKIFPRSGPRYFFLNLLVAITSHKYLKVSYNTSRSKYHLHNSGDVTIKYFSSIPPSKSILRLDGIGFESYEGEKRKQYVHTMNELVNKSHALIFQSNFSKSIFQDFYSDLILSKPHTVITNGSSQLSSSINKRKLQKSYNIYLPDKFFVVAGRNVPRKRINLIIDLFKSLPQYNLVVLSDVSSNFFEYPNIYPLGILPPGIARYIISISTALIHVDTYDWCPNIVVNALYDGASIICSNYGGTPEIVRKSCNNHFIIQEHHTHSDTFDYMCNLSSAKFPLDLFYDALDKAYNKQTINLTSQYEFSIDYSAFNYSSFIQGLSC
ncbi:hypothetical protein [Synechococcus sp. RS9916]|uniref:hypothetical protein n=1 Tax=Synechococcus sp. RS9916 TaxID=221359 RepID=UPI00031D92FE|nr:hypothetical protein [Synechococcus sp. RS9916]